MGVVRKLSRQGDERYEWDQALVMTGDQTALLAAQTAAGVVAAALRAGDQVFLRTRVGAVPISEFIEMATEIIILPKV